MSASAPELGRYPDPQQREVKAALAQRLGVSKEQLFLGNGSDEAIDLLIRAFCDPGTDAIQIFPPTYGMYRVAADINAVKVVETPLNSSFELPAEEAVNQSAAGIKLRFVCSPNNPSATLIDQETICKLLACPTSYTIVDEAYIDFAPGSTCLGLLEQFDNLIILRTFSKAWGLAGIRLGVAIAAPEVIAVLNRIKPPYNVSALSQSAAIAAIRSQEPLAYIDKSIEQRCYLEQQLEALEIVSQVVPSKANFLLVRFLDADAVYNYLKDNSCIVRNRSNLPNCDNCLRITVGTPDQNERLIKLLGNFESKLGERK